MDLGEKVGKLNSRGGFCKFRFGLREKSWEIEFWRGGYSVTLDLDLGKKVGKLNSGGGDSVTSDLDLGKKVGKLNSRGGIL